MKVSTFALRLHVIIERRRPCSCKNSTDRLFSFFSFKKASHCEEFHQDCDPTHADEEEEESATSTVVLEDVLGVAGL